MTLVGHVPDGGLKHLIGCCERDPAIDCVSLTTEEEGIALVTGGWLGGSRGAVLMQSSGVGDRIRLLSLLASCQVPALLIVTMGREAVRRRWGVAVMISLALVVVKVSTDIPTQVVPPRDGTHLVERFRAALA
ncbi:MAG: hypothetical protein GY698_09745 [Actinomycetia bacterium]|nr:hypothetical protein [Actinomycetes bacterium]